MMIGNGFAAENQPVPFEKLRFLIRVKLIINAYLISSSISVEMERRTLEGSARPNQASASEAGEMGGKGFSGRLPDSIFITSALAAIGIISDQIPTLIFFPFPF